MHQRKKIINSVLFVGLSHAGQVFTLCWSKKFKSASVFDFDKERLKNFQNGILTQEEPELYYLYKNKIKNITFEKKENLKKYQNIFFTEDTLISKNGEPDVKDIISKLKRISNFIAPGANLFLSSQVSPGFTRKIYIDFFKKKKINLIYYLETLKMGNAIERFLKPSMLVLGTDDNNRKKPIYKLLKEFNCPIFFKNFEEAETVKLAINIYLSCSVSFANSLDFYCRENGFFFSSISEILKLDKRIGKFAYINPSLGLCGGHLERDLNYVIDNSKNRIVTNKFKNILKIEDQRILLLVDAIKKLPKKFKSYKIIWLGISYKKESFSLVNAWYFKFKKNMRREIFFYDHFNIEEYKLKNFLQIKKINFEKTIFIYNYLNNKDELFFRKKILSAKNSLVYNISNETLKFENKRVF